MTFRTRFAPSPTGPLHLGHAYSAMLAHDMAQRHAGAFLLRIEDIDQSRARAHWENQIFEDLSWLGLSWPTPVMRQSDRLGHYTAALEYLKAMGLLYPCTCNRRDIQMAVAAPQEGIAAPQGPDGLVYPGTCRQRSFASTGDHPFAIRLNMQMAIERLTATQSPFPLRFREECRAPNGPVDVLPTGLIESVGDIVLARRDMGTSYHLSVVVDDAAQDITQVVRGADLFDATQIHVLLQKLLGLPTPVYHHHRLIRDSSGKRLAKRDDDRAIAKYREDGLSPKDLRQMVGLAPTSQEPSR